MTTVYVIAENNQNGDGLGREQGPVESRLLSRKLGWSRTPAKQLGINGLPVAILPRCNAGGAHAGYRYVVLFRHHRTAPEYEVTPSSGKAELHPPYVRARLSLPHKLKLLACSSLNTCRAHPIMAKPPS